MNLMNAFALIREGGPVMIPLLACAVISLAVMVERFIALHGAAADSEQLMGQVKSMLERGRASDALKLCETASGPIPILLANGIRTREMDSDAIERQMEELALRETPLLYRRLGVLDTIITIAPLLGLLGTVTGMIRAFHVVGSAASLNNPTGITSGVAEALIATAFGLAIAIVTLVGYNYLTERVKDIIADMEVRATQLLNLLAGLRSREGRRSEITAASA